MALTDITVIRQDTCDFNITFQDSSGDAIDITGYEVWFTVRTSLPKTTITDDSDAIISKSYTGGGATGIISVELDSSDTNINVKTYKYDVQYKKPDGTIKSSGAYDFIVASDVTRDT